MNTYTADDVRWMAEALRLARQGLYTTTPNPRVGCVLVKQGEVVGAGWHYMAGEPHAEVHALAAAGAQARGATAYVTLEPCSHTGRTPPCADALIAAGVSRVVAAMEDPNPLVAGQGLQRLQAAGIAVECGVLADEARALNIGFVSRMSRQRPWVRLKLGMSLDGRSALANGKSQWITGPESRADVQRWRARSCAVLTGIGTVLADDPRLTVRDFPIERQPLRVVVDNHLDIPKTASLLHEPQVLIAHASRDAARIARLDEAGAALWHSPGDGALVDLPALLDELARRQLNEILVEAGARLAGAFMRAGLVDELLLYQAPVILGSEARGLFDGLFLTELTDAPRWRIIDQRRLGPDTRIQLIKD